jgi:hypothetical protein
LFGENAHIFDFSSLFAAPFVHTGLLHKTFQASHVPAPGNALRSGRRKSRFRLTMPAFSDS